jgi:quinol monooxygenase YgiN
MESAFTFGGLPVLLLVALWTRNTVRKDPEEIHTFAWTLYLTITTILSLIMVITSEMSLFQGLFGNSPVRGKFISQLFIWGGLWLFHFTLHIRKSKVENQLGEHILSSTLGLIFSSVGLFQIFASLTNRILGFNNDELLNSGTKPFVTGLITLAIGAPIWFIYWFRTTQKASKERLWYAYVLLLGVGGGLLMTVISLSFTIDSLLVWFWGDVSQSASQHFKNMPTTIAATLTGAIILWYHRAILASAEESTRSDVRRVYEYSVAAIGLLAAGGGLTMIVVSIIQSITQSTQITGSGSINTLLGAVTLIVVGGLVWWLQWNSIQHLVARDREIEQGSFIRRVYLLVLFGVVGVTAVIVLLICAYDVFFDLFQSGVSLATLNKMRVPLGIFITALGVSLYHWSIYRREKDVEIIHGGVKLAHKALAFLTMLVVLPENREQVLKELDKYAGVVRKEKGCERFEVLIDSALTSSSISSSTVPNEIYIFEVWGDAHSHELHVSSPGFTKWPEFSNVLVVSSSVKTLESPELSHQ